ncbi:MAG TPA: ABC transporter permease subunit/CPBP intramembrane protease [Pirellulaceae bacterium]|nr:ABC transporter permease subunit/CPBP intramembrane protease [Pirellulaceae bacterium]
MSAPPPPSPPAAPPGHTRVPQHDLGRWLRLARKELRETLRDRRTIVTLLLMPILVYPLLSMGFRQFLISSFDKPGGWTFLIAAESVEAANLIQREVIQAGDELLRAERGALASAAAGADPADSADEELAPGEPRAEFVHVEPVSDLDESVSSGKYDLAIRLATFAEGTQERPQRVHVRYELIYREGSPPGQMLVQFVERRLAAVNQFRLQRRLLTTGRSTHIPNSWTYNLVKAPPNQSLLTLVPLILILMTITGAVYPAIDLTAGERERGTLESLMAAPVPRLGMLFAKYVAVVTVALLTAAMNLTAMFITAYSMGLTQYIFGEAGLSITTVLLIVLLLVLFAAFFSAVLLAVTSFARSFKEAQAYLIPLMLLAISPGLFTLMPSVEMNVVLAVTPLLNMVLLARDVLHGTANPLLAGMAIVSTILYALLAIALAARVFGSDAMLFGSQASWSDLFRRPERPRTAPTLSGVALCTALAFALQSVGGGLLAALAGEGASLEFAYIGSAIVTILLFLVLPLIMALAQFVPVTAAFQIRGASPVAFAGALLLGLSLWPLAHELILFSGLIDPDLLDKVRAQAAEIRSISPALLILSVAIVPAVCEEWFFRGYLLGAIRERTSAWSAILLTALLFGLFHVFVTVILPVRFLPSLSLGIVLGYVCWRTGSVLPGMLLHAVHNGLLILMGRYQTQLAQWGFGASETQHVPPLWLAAAAAVALIGLALVWASGRPAGAEQKPAALPVPS